MARQLEVDAQEEVDNAYSQICISLPTREVITLYNISNQMTILHLKSIIELYSGIPSNVQILQYLTNTDLQDDRSLISYGIKTRDQLILTFPVTWTSLFFATWYGDIHEVFFSGVILTDTYRYTEEEVTMLSRIIATRSFFAVMLSARQGNVELIKQLRQKGADLSCCSQFGRNPLHIAAWHGHVNCVDYLIRVNCPILSYDLNGKTPMHLATQRHQDRCQRRIWLHIWNSRSQLIRAKRQSRDDSQTIQSQIKMIEEFITGPSIGNTEVEYERSLLSKWYDPFHRDRDEILLRLNNITIGSDRHQNQIHHKKAGNTTYPSKKTSKDNGMEQQLISFEQLPATYPILTHDISNRQQAGLRIDNNDKFERWFSAKKKQVQYILECCIDWNGRKSCQDIDITFEEWLEMNTCNDVRSQTRSPYNNNSLYTYDHELQGIRCERDYDPDVFTNWLETTKSKARQDVEHQTVQKITAIRRNRGMTFSQLLEVKRRRDYARLMVLEEIIDKVPSANSKRYKNQKNNLTFEEWLKLKNLEHRVKQYKSSWIKLRKKQSDKRNYSASKQSYDQWLGKKLFRERERQHHLDLEKMKMDRIKMENDLERKMEIEKKLINWCQQKSQLKKQEMIKKKQDEVYQKQLKQQALAKKKNIKFDQWFDKSIENEIAEMLKTKMQGKSTGLKYETNTIVHN